MTSSSLLAFATSSANYVWGFFSGFLFDNGGLVFYVVLAIVTAIIGLVIALLYKMFKI